MLILADYVFWPIKIEEAAGRVGQLPITIVRYYGQDELTMIFALSPTDLRGS